MSSVSSDIANKPILIVDDVEFIRDVSTATLQKAGFKNIRSISAADKALDLMATGDYKPDCVITDLKMPRTHGLQFLKKVRTGKVKAARGLPIAMLTGYAETALIRIAVLLDVDAFLAKPVAGESLTKHVTRLLQMGTRPDDELMPVDLYDAIDVDSPVEHIIAAEEEKDEKLEKAIEDLDGASPSAPTPDDELNDDRNHIQAALDLVQAGTMVARDVLTDRGIVLVRRDEELSERSINRLLSLAEIGETENSVWVYAPEE